MFMSEGILIFKVGVVVVVFIDWCFYDLVYIECFMCIFKENMEGYNVVFVINCVNKLNGELLLIYGIVDDNVYLCNNVEYSEVLV